MNTTCEKEFVWSDELVREMIYAKLPIPEHYCGQLQRCLDEFKQLKMEREQYKYLSVVFTQPTRGKALWQVYKYDVSEEIPEGASVFATEEEAKDFIICQCPCLSLMDLISVWEVPEQREVYSRSALFLKFKKIVQQKINQHQ